MHIASWFESSRTCILMHKLHWFWFQSQKDLKRGFELLSSLKKPYFGYFVLKRISWSPCVGNAFRKFEHVRITIMVIVKVWFVPKWLFYEIWPVFWIGFGWLMVWFWELSVDRLWKSVDRYFKNVLGFSDNSNYRSTDFVNRSTPCYDYCSILLSGWGTVAIFTVSVDRFWKPVDRFYCSYAWFLK